MLTFRVKVKILQNIHMNEKIRQEIEELDWNNSDSVVSFYESNRLYFDNYNFLKSTDSIYEIADIKISYILSLDNKNHYTKANDCLQDVDILINKIKNSEYYEEINEKYLFAAGVIAFRLDKVEESQDYFTQLVKIDPDNDLYQNWFEGNKDYLFAKSTKLIGHIGFGLLFITIFSDLVFEIDNVIRLRIELISFIIMIFGYYGYAIKRFLKKHKIIYK